MRVYDLAKELGKDSSKEILDILEKHDINLKSSSNISDDQASIVRKSMGGAGKAAKEGRTHRRPRNRRVMTRPELKQARVSRTRRK